MLFRLTLASLSCILAAKNYSLQTKLDYYFTSSPKSFIKSIRLIREYFGFMSAF